MLEDSKNYSEYTVHIVLATNPQKQENEFHESVKRDFFGKYRKEAIKYCSSNHENYWLHNNDKNTPVLYNPLSYFILGNYDVAYISLIDNFKFAQRLFEPQDDNTPNPDLFFPHTFQCFTGITHFPKRESLKEFFYNRLKIEKPIKKYFLGICNLKLNNGFLIGNGRKYLDSVVKLINSTIEKYNNGKEDEKQIDYLIMQTFSWFELSLIIFTDDADAISLLIKELRRVSVSDLDTSEDLVRDSLYRSLFEKEQENLMKANVFADTHTYIGIHSDLILSNTEDEFFKKFLAQDLKIKTQIEWQVKPGHMHLLAPLLKDEKTDDDKQIFNDNEESRYLLAGKSDYLLMENSDSVNNNVHLLRIIHDKNCKLFDHVRKIKTRILFNVTTSKDESRKVFNLQEILQQLAIKAVPIGQIDKHLKALKISRQIRSKILKIFSNYNNGVQDIILFPFFLDFKIFIDELQKHIIKERNNWDERLTGDNYNLNYGETVSQFEKLLMKLIEIFQEGYNIRMLNCYQFEDINDFDLDFNSSIQQLLSVYSTLAIEIGTIFYTAEYEYGPIVQLNLKDTVSNYSSINYYVHHLTSPEFVFATFTKEILNFSRFEDSGLSNLIANYKLKKIEIGKKNRLLEEMMKNNLIDFNYLLNDSIRFVVTYNNNFNLFYFWFWTYNLQNSSLYDKNGALNEEHFKKELFRILFIHKLFGFDLVKEPINCPLPELFSYWDRHFSKILQAVDDYLMGLDELGISVDLMHLVFKIYDKSLSISLGNSIIPTIDIIAIYQKFSYIRNKYRIQISGQMLSRVSKKEFAYMHLNKNYTPTTEFTVSTQSLIYLQWYMYQYLETIYQLNDEKVSLLRRNWANGKPLISFVLSNNIKHLYSVDQTGGLFFDNFNQLNQYFQLSSMVLSDIWNYSQIKKKHFILSKLQIAINE